MKRSTLGIIGIGLVIALVILVVALPASGGNVSGPQNGTGNQYGGQMFQNGAGQAGNGNGTCIREDCPNNGTPKRDGTGQKLGQSGKGSGNGGQSGHRGQGSGQGCSSQCRR
jgi:hypothetical protein